MAASSFDSRWNVWGSAYGGQSNAGGDTATGSNSTRANVYGFAAGADHRVSADTLVGFALAGGGTSWNVANGLGGGKSDAIQLGVYGTRQFGASYVSAAAAYAWHRMSTDRTLTVAGTDKLRADFDANNIGGRLEAGHRFVVQRSFGITPYAAAQVQAFLVPGYSESATSGSNQFAPVLWVAHVDHHAWRAWRVVRRPRTDRRPRRQTVLAAGLGA